MAWALVSHDSADGDNNTVTVGPISTSGASLLIAWVASYDVAPVLSDTASNTWTPLTERGSGPNHQGQFYYVNSATPNVSGTHSFTAAAATSYPTLYIMAWSGSAATPFDQQNGTFSASGAGTSLATGSITPSENNTLIVAGWAGEDDIISNLAINSSFTLLDSEITSLGDNTPGATAYFLQGTAGAINPTWSWTTSIGCAVAIASFKMGAAGTGILRQMMAHN